MKNINEILNKPIFFKRNRVWRVYSGGKLFSGFFGDNSTDSFYPEEWIASFVKALNKESNNPKEGVSVIEDTNIYFDDILNQYPKELLGEYTDFGILTKVLDSAIRLPVQAHPDKEYSKKYLGSEYGKAEAWVVLDTRPDACIYFGFKEKITKEDFYKAVEKSKTDKTFMETILNRIPVKSGDVFFVPGKTVHAIGKGCLILEFQEPTDFTIQPEYWCGDYNLNQKEMYIGLDSDKALDVFDYNLFGESIVDKGRCIPKIIYNNGCRIENLITTENTDCFKVQRYIIEKSDIILTKAPAVYIVTDGNGKICSNKYERVIKKGDYFFLPFNAKNEFNISSDDFLEVTLCFK